MHDDIGHRRTSTTQCFFVSLSQRDGIAQEQRHKPGGLNIWMYSVQLAALRGAHPVEAKRVRFSTRLEMYMRRTIMSFRKILS